MREHRCFGNGFPPPFLPSCHRETHRSRMKERCDVLARFCNSTHSPLLPTTRHASLRHSRSVAEVYCGCHFKISLSTFGFGGTPRCPGLTSSKQFQFSLSLPLPRSLSLSLVAHARARTCPNLEWLSRATIWRLDRRQKHDTNLAKWSSASVLARERASQGE